MSDTSRYDEVAEVRAEYAGRPGVSGQVEQALAERANAEAYGADTSGPDRRLEHLGHARQRTRGEAAMERRATAEEQGGEEQRHTPPEGRQARPQDTTAAAGTPAAKGGKQDAAGGQPKGKG